MASGTNEDHSECPCSQNVPGAKWIKCGAVGCQSPWWHVNCAGLEGLTDAQIRKLKYSCPKCTIAALGLKVVSDDTMLSKDISEEIQKCLPAIVKTVVKETSEAMAKSYADTLKKENKAIMKETVKTTSQTALKETMKRVDANFTEQRKRTRNLIVSGIDENENEDLINEVSKVLKGVDRSFPNGQILNCKRLGAKKDGNETDSPRQYRSRLIVVTLRNENDAVFFHNNGTGRQCQESIWLNADLTKDEREARYKLRCERRQKNKARTEETSPSSAETSSTVNSDDPKN